MISNELPSSMRLVRSIETSRTTNETYHLDLNMSFLLLFFLSGTSHQGDSEGEVSTVSPAHSNVRGGLFELTTIIGVLLIDIFLTHNINVLR